MEIKIDVGETIIRRDHGHMGDAIVGFIYLGLISVGILLALINPLIGAIPALFGIAGLKKILLLPVILFMCKKVEFICTDKKLIIKSTGGKVEYYNLNEIESVEPKDDYFIFKFFNMSKKFHYGYIHVKMKEKTSARYNGIVTTAIKNHHEWCKVISEQMAKLD